jgi:Cu/Ag efflux pump CusA
LHWHRSATSASDHDQAHQQHDCAGHTSRYREQATGVECALRCNVEPQRLARHNIADVRVKPTPNVIERTNSSRRIDVIANIEGQDLGAVVKEIEDELEDVAFAQGYHAELKGEFAEREAAQNRLLLFAGAAAVGIFLLLQSSFGSWRLATLTFVTLPMALVGGLLAVFAGDGIISL